ncbi:signal recognition particle-docking protein FtsY [Hornefia butyriciproducens]|uniref:signal recognition particle-docking protein FtsY n=1 Tax=Hornefia butyriciproducens TaxID=2652293 RepID=UPI0023F35ABA|nr:signal recognition particle-docking protein FtsY [Hornefia butyriciproducens]MCI7327960.1 signal recognition particle-docking protein FtsY [Clostridiales bacterium]MCI7413423.1 signal recognition particle-docking protein FtsY [Clostridiales bacterium]MDD6298590.1 signal recognition particle-docking protein FtsY [Hornefia butyriciproducens]MDY2989992.1 signal recognition particle-docking protein FtsY [Hornefia butyriciproducens]MDY6212263.1 signal recognition particle-docking protein FtsY [H
MSEITTKKKGFFGRMAERINDALFMHQEINEEMMDEIEEILITSDIGMETTMNIMEELREYIKVNMITLPKNVKKAIVEIIIRLIDKGERNRLSDKTPLVILMIGINGGGKTTTIAKLGNRLKKEGRTVMFAAADTFRAAASGQLKIWGDRIGVNTVMHQEGADPSAVLFDAIQSAKARNIDVLICDTAGRLQTKKNLMDELAKMNRVIDREYPEAARETLLVLDATNGKNAVSQAEQFNEAAELSGVIITKLDGTAKGGIAITIADEFDLPIKFIGTGEGVEDLEEFNAAEFAAEVTGGIADE